MSVVPTRTAAALAFAAFVLFAVGTNVQAGWLMVITAMLVGTLVAGSILPVMAVRGVRVDRVAPDEAWADAPVAVTLTVTNTSRSVRGLVLVRDSFLGEGAAVVDQVRPGEQRSYRGSRSGARRGLYLAGECTVQTGAPFGVVLARRRFILESRTLVYPPVLHVPVGLLPGAGDTGSGLPRRAHIGDTSSVREYRPGDTLRHVHWRTAARTGKVVVREFEDQAHSAVAVVADTSHDADVLDVIASAAVSFAIAALRDGRKVVLIHPSAQGVTVTSAHSESGVLRWGALLTSQPAAALEAAVRATPAGHAAVVVAEAGAAHSALPAIASLPGCQAVIVDPRDAADPPGPQADTAASALRSKDTAAVVIPTTGDIASCLQPRVPAS